MNPVFQNVKDLITRGKREIEVKYPFIINRILSCNPGFAITALKINKYVGRVPEWALNKLFNTCVPKRHTAPYFNYIRKSKMQNPKAIEQICEIYGVNEYHAKQIFLIFRKNNDDIHKHLGLKEGE